MKTPFLLFILLCASGLNIRAQQYAQNFGKINVNEVTMASYALDKAAEALVLYDVGNTYFSPEDDGFRIVFERSTKIKIFNRAGLDYAQIEIPFYMENLKMETVYDVEAYVYNMENNALKTTAFDNRNIFEERLSENWRVKKFALPDVREGSVIEYRYKIMSPYIFNLQDWVFQRKIPTVYSQYTVRMTPFYDYIYNFQGGTKFDFFEQREDNMTSQFGPNQYHDMIYTFGMKNVPAFKDEVFITSINDYIMKMDFQLSVLHYPVGTNLSIISTWPLLVEDFLKEPEFGGYLKAMTRSAEDLLAALSLNGKTDREKAESIYNYVKVNFNWNRSKTKFTTKSARDFLKDKTGNSAEINLMLCAMLNAAGIQAFPVLLSTRDHGKIYKDYPFQQYLNYAIVLASLNNQDILLDATEPLIPFGVLPSRCINETGLVVNKNKAEWIPLEDKTGSELTDTIHIVLNVAADSCVAAISRQTTGHKALEYRQDYLQGHETLQNSLLQEGMAMKDTLVTENLETIEKPFICKYSVFSAVEQVADKLLVQPFPGAVYPENPLKLPYRSYPVDMMYRNRNNFVATIDIPEGYSYLPGDHNISVDNALVNIQYHVENSAGTLKITGMYEFKKPVYKNTEYYDLRSYMGKIVEKFNEKLVLVKNN
jgi:transglutaminase-like putative cysteine protease